MSLFTTLLNKIKRTIMGLSGRKRRRKHHRHLPHHRRRRTSQQAGNHGFISGRVASTIYAALLIVAIVLVSFGFPLVLLGIVFMFEGRSYHPSVPGVMCMVTGASGAGLGILICRYTHKRTHRVANNKVGVTQVFTVHQAMHDVEKNSGVADIQVSTKEPFDNHEILGRPYGDSSSTNMSWSDLSLGSQSCAQIQQVRRQSTLYSLLVTDMSHPPKPPDNYTVPPLYATPMTTMSKRGHGLQPSQTQTSEQPASVPKVWTISSSTSHNSQGNHNT